MIPTVDIAAAVVINRTDRPDRLMRFYRHWQALGWDLPLMVFPAVVTPDGTMGCMGTHMAALMTDKPTLVLEDDAVFDLGQVGTHQAPPEDWEVLWLGGQHVAAPAPVQPGWVRPVTMMRTHAYIAREPYRLATMFMSQGYRRLDPHMASLPLRQYAVSPQWVGQTAGESDTGGAALPVDTWWR